MGVITHVVKFYLYGGAGYSIVFLGTHEECRAVAAARNRGTQSNQYRVEKFDPDKWNLTG